MTGIRLLLACAACLLAAPAYAQPADTKHQSKPSDAEIRRQHAQMVAYGEWLVRLNTALADANTALTQVQGEWSKAMQAPSLTETVKQFRVVIRDSKLEVAKSRRKLDALDAPEFPELHLDENLTTKSLIGQMRAQLDVSEKLMDSFNPLLDAMLAGKMDAVRSAGNNMLDAAIVLLNSQALMSEASLATTDKESGLYEAQQTQVEIFRSASRITEAARLSLLQEAADPKLGGDLEAFADRLAVLISRGRTKLGAEIARTEAAAAQGAKQGQSDAEGILRRTVAVYRVDMRIFDVAERYAASLREGVALARAGKLKSDETIALLRHFRTARDAIMRIGVEESEVLARGPGT